MKYFIIPGVLLLFITSLNLIAQWVRSSNGMGDNVLVFSIVNNGNNIFAGTGTAPNPQGIYSSTDNGSNWTQTSLNNRDVRCIAVNRNNIFAGTYSNYGAYLSTDYGTNWAPTSLNGGPVLTFAFKGNYIFGAGYFGIYLSTNNGTNWTQTGLNNENVFALAANENTVFAGCEHNNGVYRSTDNGASWAQILNGQYINALATNGNNIFAGTLWNGVYRSTNNGASWSTTSLNNRTIFALVISGNNIFAGADFIGTDFVGTDSTDRFYISTNNGANWTERTEGLPNSRVHAICILNNYIFAGTALYGITGNGVYRRPLGELVGIEPTSNEIPNNFSLYQNYPNPFNPVTKIRFNILLLRGVSEGRAVLVNLLIYDNAGKLVATIVNENMKAGRYEVEFDAKNLSSGVYYYKLIAGDYTQTKKMVLIK